MNQRLQVAKRIAWLTLWFVIFGGAFLIPSIEMPWASHSVHRAMMPHNTNAMILQDEEMDLPFDEELIADGRILFERTAGQVGCAACHNAFGTGDSGVGPYVRGVSQENILNALEGIEEMEFFDLSNEEVSAITEYLRWLGQYDAAKTLIKRGAFSPEELTVKAGHKIQFIFENADRSEHTLSSADLDLEGLALPGRKTVDYLWTAPEAPGTLTILCTDCGEGVSLPINVEAAEE